MFWIIVIIILCDTKVSKKTENGEAFGGESVAFWRIATDFLRNGTLSTCKRVC